MAPITLFSTSIYSDYKKWNRLVGIVLRTEFMLEKQIYIPVVLLLAVWALDACLRSSFQPEVLKDFCQTAVCKLLERNKNAAHFSSPDIPPAHKFTPIVASCLFS